jgi:hypothetical protein
MGEPTMTPRRRFTTRDLEAIRVDKIVGLRAGDTPHRVIGIWAVVAKNRVFVRSWSLTSGGWFRTFLATPRGSLFVGSREIRVRAVHTSSEPLKAAVDRAYADKYNTPGSLQYVRDLKRPRSRNATIELVPV